MSKPERTELEQRIIYAESLGEKWASLHEVAMQLEEDKKNYLAALMNDLAGTALPNMPPDKTMTETKLERLARGSPQYREYIRNMCIAKGEELRAKVKYDNARDLFEAARSKESTEREKMKTLKFIP
jgi:hypothetical protein